MMGAHKVKEVAVDCFYINLGVKLTCVLLLLNFNVFSHVKPSNIPGEHFFFSKNKSQIMMLIAFKCGIGSLLPLVATYKKTATMTNGQLLVGVLLISRTRGAVMRQLQLNTHQEAQRYSKTYLEKRGEWKISVLAEVMFKTLVFWF